MDHPDVRLLRLAGVLFVVGLLGGCISSYRHYEVTKNADGSYEVDVVLTNTDTELGDMQITKNADGSVTVTLSEYSTTDRGVENTGKALDLLNRVIPGE